MKNEIIKEIKDGFKKEIEEGFNINVNFNQNLNEYVFTIKTNNYYGYVYSESINNMFLSSTKKFLLSFKTNIKTPKKIIDEIEKILEKKGFYDE